MFGDYAMNTQPQTLAIRQNKDTRQASGDIARLNGCRFLNASEPPKNMNFDCALLKTLIGNDKITARNLYEREFEFFPHFKLFVNTNYLPVITDTTLFYSGRINVLTFDRHFEEWEQDKSLKSKLKTPENISGIFNWCLEGLKKFRKSGAIPPPKVKKSTQDYCKKSDNVGIYIDECLKKSNKSISAKDVYQHFLCWCSDNGYNALSKTNFYDELKNRGMFSASGTINGQTTRNVIKGYEIIET
jgi:putative DNA primase/helicase